MQADRKQAHGTFADGLGMQRKDLQKAIRVERFWLNKNWQKYQSLGWHSGTMTPKQHPTLPPNFAPINQI